MPTGASRVTINGTVFERRVSFIDATDLGVSFPVKYDWYINGLHVDAMTFKERFDEAARWRAAQNARRTLKPLEWTEDDREFLRSLRIAADDDVQDKAA
jgi:hypothetical protein